MSQMFYCGIRNVPAFTMEVRGKLGLSYKVLSKYLKISPIEIYKMECGRFLSEPAVRRLIVLNRYSQLLRLISLSIRVIIKAIEIPFGWCCNNFISIPFLLISGRMRESDRQLYLPCCWRF